MVAISRITAVFSGSAVVGPAQSSVFTTGQPDDVRNAWIAFWGSCLGAMPPALTCTIPSTGETYEDSTGVLLEIWSAGAPSVQNGSNSDTTFARGVGGRCVWSTQGLTGNRRVRGSTYLVPLSASQYASDGTIENASVTALAGAADDFVVATTGDFSIWTRPINGAGGKSSGVVAGTFPDKISTLRSRRV